VWLYFQRRSREVPLPLLDSHVRVLHVGIKSSSHGKQHSSWAKHSSSAASTTATPSWRDSAPPKSNLCSVTRIPQHASYCTKVFPCYPLFSDIHWPPVVAYKAVNETAPSIGPTLAPAHLASKLCSTKGCSILRENSQREMQRQFCDYKMTSFGSQRPLAASSRHILRGELCLRAVTESYCVIGQCELGVFKKRPASRLARVTCAAVGGPFEEFPGVLRLSSRGV